ncbi:hypothetical protein [Butyrivibrio sp. VCB2006]|uniref:hypothetical protein n=1 Tax=Butyrivibrio sp. VCB2006 TaxID=1280679 RepID=UPI0004928E00|nr:hypothetical protein [Butyrivibrio sp. VCB2006]
MSKQKRNWLTKNLLRVFFVALTLFALWYFDEALCIKDDVGTNQTRAMYYQPRNSVDVAMLGSSHIHCDIDTGLLWHDYGIASIDYSAAEQPLWITYHYLKELCKYQSPKVVVLDLYSPALRKDDYQYDWIRPNIFGLRFSLNKLQMLSVSVEKDKLFDYFPDFAYYHGRLGDLTKEDFLYPFTKREKLTNFKGFTPYFNVNSQVQPVIEQEESGGLTLKSEIYLQKIIDYTKANDIELFLIVAPYVTNDSDELVYNRVKEIARMNEIGFNSTNYDYSEMGLDFATDFNDDSHLNYWGAQKFTRYLGNELKANYELPDRRGDSKYNSWYVNYQQMQQYASAGN